MPHSLCHSSDTHQSFSCHTDIWSIQTKKTGFCWGSHKRHQQLLDNDLEGKQIKMICHVCNAPSRAMVKKIKQYSGYFGWDKCIQKGTWILGPDTYPEVDNLTLRTNDIFCAEVTRRQENEDIPMSPFFESPIEHDKSIPNWLHGLEETERCECLQAK